MPMAQMVEKVKVLIEALPYMRRFEGKTFVIKYGGNAMVDDQLKNAFAMDVILMRQVGINPVIVHGGGPQIGQIMTRMGLKPHFIDGLRVTDEETVNVVEMVLAGKVNKDIVNLINLNGGRAAGLSGKDGHTIQARKLTHVRRGPEVKVPEIIDLGWVGDVERIDTTLLDRFRASDIIPVVAPVGVGAKGETYNINADSVAGHLAVAMGAEKLILLTDVPGVLDTEGNLISQTPVDDINHLIKTGVIRGGMIPKTETCRHARNNGVSAAHIIDGRIEHALLLEVFTDRGIGTVII
ncbi:acetylglutamate kinase [Magnetofaba australis]|uniref:Acetylglutamate kinase n=1 Tax=Magnetofaba australis IT-1 TaxID=1434232 RepID=A0A1Y2K2D5_9PROT|nr:acetylglutamate kinase [Magnetofaba australis]OSM00352.1 putative N-acetylglutamate kinase [Magnetofaba australis IT-1]